MPGPDENDRKVEKWNYAEITAAVSDSGLAADVRAEFNRICETSPFSDPTKYWRNLLAYFLLNADRGITVSQEALLCDFFQATTAKGDPSKARTAKLKLSTLLDNYIRDYNPSVKITLEGYRIDIDRSITQLEAFFGDGALKRRGAIILQSDPIALILGKHVEADSTAPRLFKARTWIDHFDMEGAKAVCRRFETPEIESLGARPPELVISVHDIEDPIDPDAPFQIAMGLGFTDETETIVTDACRGWMAISHGSKYGDAIALHPSLIPEDLPADSLVIPGGKDLENGFVQLAPCDWDDTYVSRWLQGRSPHKPNVYDYAVILRDTDTAGQGPRRVRFVLAGFTERSTAIAGLYFAEHWERLAGRFGATHDSQTYGDFLVVIAGKSNVAKWKQWQEIAAFEVTPQRLVDKGINCKWFRRLQPHR